MRYVTDSPPYATSSAQCIHEIQSEGSRMKKISGRAYGKVNLSLDVTGRRNDGYHLVRMVMQTVGIHDTVTITAGTGSGSAAGRMAAAPETKAAEDGIRIVTDSGAVPSGPDNLVWKAADVMRRRYGITDDLEIRLEKRIPVAAGMAGGSADAAAVFRLLRDFYELEAPDEDLQKLALPLGADIPYCITGGTQLSEGIGEVLTKLPDAPQTTLLVVKPDVDVSTGWVYRAFDSIPKDEVRHPDVDGMVRAIRRGDLKGMCACCGNVLEQQTGSVYPVIGELERFFMKRGALTSLMTGSGPTVFAVYEDAAAADEAFRELRAAPEYASFAKFRTEFQQ